jgi:hypothetical protein
MALQPNHALPTTGATPSPLLIDVTWRRALKIWWSIFWRWALVAVLIGAILGLILTSLSLSPTSLEIAKGLLSFVLGPPIGVWAIHTVLRKRWSDFRIALLA